MASTLLPRSQYSLFQIGMHSLETFKEKSIFNKNAIECINAIWCELSSEN